MSAHPLRIQRALHEHRLQMERNAEARRLKRSERIRERFVRLILLDRGGWLWLSMACGIAIGVLIHWGLGR